MMKGSECELMLSKSHKSNSCVGIGLITLDIIIDDLQKSRPLTHAGGSCCNVLTILAYLGWNSIPIGKIANDSSGKMIIHDLKKWGVDTSNISLDDSSGTPIIIEKLGKRRSGANGHIFSLKCPVCGSFLPRFKPMTLREIRSRFSNTLETDVFYFDRVSPSSIELAKKYKKRGAFVFFEPPKIKNERKYQECYETADVIKFSDEKTNNSSIERLADLETPLLIETMGANGLQYQLKNKKWEHLLPFHVSNFIDAAGAGDWCSAGFIHYMHKYKNNSASDFFTEENIRNALTFGQCLSAINCQFIGARGSMYQLSKRAFDNTICKMMNGENPNLHLRKSASKKKIDTIEQFCPKCK